MAEQLKTDLIQYLSQFVTAERQALFQRVIARRTRYLALVLEDIEDPHDACAVMRSCECFGVQDLYMVANRVDFKLSAGVAVGASKWISARKFADSREQAGMETPGRRCLAELRRLGYCIAALSAQPGVAPIHDLPLDRKVALWMGSETSGLSAALLAEADVCVRLPTHGFVADFNLSVAAALALSILRARLEESGVDFRLARKERRDLQLAWLARSPKRIKSLVARFLTDHNLRPEQLRDACIERETLQLLL